MIQGKTSSGFEFSIPDSTRDNMELIDAIADYDDGNALGISRTCQIMLGKDQKKALYDHLRDENGKVSFVSVTKELIEMINAAGKNS